LDNRGSSVLTRLAYSSDGINWTANTSASALLDEGIFTVVWNGSLWLAGGNCNPNPPTSDKIIYSYDGITWAASESQRLIFTGICVGLAWNGQRFVGIGGQQIAQSTNGLDWVAGISPFVGGSGDCVACNNIIWVAGGNGPFTLAYSYDGITWTGSASGSALFTTQCISVAWNGSLWVAAGSGTNSLIYSSDGITWSASASGTALFPTAATYVCWNGSQWMAGSIPPITLGYSYDGITWIPSQTGSALFTGAVAGFGSRRIAPYTSAQTQILTESSAPLTITTSPVDIDCSSTNNYILTLTQDTALQLINPPPAGCIYTLKIFIIQDGTGSRLVTWPLSILWGTGASAPILTTTPNSTDIIELITYNAGTTWFGIPKGIGF